MDRLHLDPDDIYDPEDLDAIDSIKQKIDEERDAWEKYLEDSKRYPPSVRWASGLVERQDAVQA